MDAASSRRISRGATLAVAALPIGFFALFFAWPVASILWRGLNVDGEMDLSVFGDVVADPFMREVAWFTLWQALVSTALTLALGLPCAYVVSHYEFRGRRLFRALVTVPFVLPTVVVGTAFLVVFGPAGPLGWDLRQTIWAVLAAHVFFNVSVVIRTVGGAWDNSTLGRRRLRGCSERTGCARSGRSPFPGSHPRWRLRRPSCSSLPSRRSVWC